MVELINDHHAMHCAEMGGFVDWDFKARLTATLAAAVQRAHNVMVDAAYKCVRLTRSVRRNASAAQAVGGGNSAERGRGM